MLADGAGASWLTAVLTAVAGDEGPADDSDGIATGKLWESC